MMNPTMHAPTELHLTATRNDDLLQLTATGPNVWQPLTNITLGTSSFILEQPLYSTNRFYRGAWLP